MPRRQLANAGFMSASAMTSTHVWYSNRQTLYRVNLATNAQEQVHVFANDIGELHTNDSRCVVATRGAASDAMYELWLGDSPLEPIATHVRNWAVAPKRIVYELVGWRIVSWNFTGEPENIADGQLRGASDERILYESLAGAMTWQDGQPAPRVEFLTRHDETIYVGERYKERRAPYWTQSFGDKWLYCDSRSKIRLDRLKVASQIIKHG